MRAKYQTTLMVLALREGRLTGGATPWNKFCTVLSEVGRTRLLRARPNVHACHFPAGWVSESSPLSPPQERIDILNLLWFQTGQIILKTFSLNTHTNWHKFVREFDQIVQQSRFSQIKRSHPIQKSPDAVPVFCRTLPVWSWAWSSAHPSSLRGASALPATTRATCSDSCRRRARSLTSSSTSGSTATASSLPGRRSTSTRSRATPMNAYGQSLKWRLAFWPCIVCLFD